ATKIGLALAGVVEGLRVSSGVFIFGLSFRVLRVDLRLRVRGLQRLILRSPVPVLNLPRGTEGNECRQDASGGVGVEHHAHPPLRCLTRCQTMYPHSPTTARSSSGTSQGPSESKLVLMPATVLTVSAT